VQDRRKDGDRVQLSLERAGLVDYALKRKLING
jgi:hypothetical protein